MNDSYAMIASQCHMLAARSRARKLTAVYEAAFAPLDLTGGQFSTLVAVAQSDGPAIRDLAEYLVMDRTTMSRALRPLERRGLIELQPDPDDLRSKSVVITPEGSALLDRAIPLWRQAQNSIEE
ncbi:MarR family winged helix-turn-helix transcriptional regulator [Erythrobacter rubeus]|uniref:MarR family transcriptional regulator n=1 Tax=Erythrobacter rubeus TaxID=2760803 RepID=A0ABR8KKI4_9SPHN|nr:MarR family transcriptional regulator [Erythrobacter rubeus]MBD2840715.1 MarR family transcriptional regulator [Erythrobacter rubeus]